MTERNWGLISTGATFERLVHALVFCTDPECIAFARPGRDYGQDALSGDRSTVFQAKYHSTGISTQPISDALGELTNIKEYKDLSYKHHGKWKDVTRWVLATSLPRNPTTQEKWDTEVGPEFANLGITAELWTREQLDQRLNENPHVERVFFEGEPHVLWTLAQARGEALVNEVAQDSFTIDEIVGREQELASFDAFMESEQRVLLFSGPGGVGKSRLLFEASANALGDDWQVLWLNELALQKGGQLYLGIVPEQPTLIVLDEPNESETIQFLIREMAAGSRASDWKLLIAIRGGKTQVADEIKRLGSNYSAGPIALAPLSSESSAELARKLAEEAGLSIVDEELFDGQVVGPTGGHPMWLTIAISLVGQNIPLAELPADR